MIVAIAQVFTTEAVCAGQLRSCKPAALHRVCSLCKCLSFFFSYFKIIRIFLILQETNDHLFNVTGFCSFLRVPKQLQLLLRTRT